MTVLNRVMLHLFRMNAPFETPTWLDPYLSDLEDQAQVKQYVISLEYIKSVLIYFL